MPKKIAMPPTIDSRYQTFYRLGGIASVVIALSIVFAIAAYFIWPYKGNTTSIEAIFTLLQTDRLGGLISLDISMLLIAPINILMFLAIYAALRRVDESIALIALVLALIAVVLVIVCRPLIELTVLSDHYAAAIDPTEKLRYLAAGEVLRSSLDGTAWMMQTVFFMLAGLINCLLMLRTSVLQQSYCLVGHCQQRYRAGIFPAHHWPAFPVFEYHWQCAVVSYRGARFVENRAVGLEVCVILSNLSSEGLVPIPCESKNSLHIHSLSPSSKVKSRSKIARVMQGYSAFLAPSSAGSRARTPSRPTSNLWRPRIHACVVINHNELLIVRVWSPVGIT